MSQQNLLHAALRHAANLWRVFPCDPATKRPITEHGFWDATDDTTQIRRWWARNPTAMIGAEPPGVVIDIDPRNGGATTALKYEAEHGSDCWTDTLAVLTPSGGVHYHYLHHPDIPQGSNILGPGIDTRIFGKGYIILPPSTTNEGKGYEWYNPDAHLHKVPDWIVEAVA